MLKPSHIVVKPFKSVKTLKGKEHIIPKIADFLDPKIIFCPQLKKMPPIKKKFKFH